MRLSLMDEQEVRSFANANRELVQSVISPAAESEHKEENFFGQSFSVAMFLDFSKSLAGLLGAVETVAKVLSSAERLFKWVRGKLSGGGDTAAAETTLSERILIVVFEAYANRKAGVREDALRTILDAKPQALAQALESLEGHGVIRKAKDGTWKYVRSTS